MFADKQATEGVTQADAMEAFSVRLMDFLAESVSDKRPGWLVAVGANAVVRLMTERLLNNDLEGMEAEFQMAVDETARHLLAAEDRLTRL